MMFVRILLLLAPPLCIKSAFALSYGNITYGQTVTYGNNTYAETYLTPTAQATTWTWSQAITPAILGTVFVIINDHNQTQTVTSTNSAAVANNTRYLVNGTLSLLTRTDVNERGTVTTKLPSGGDGEIVLAYPTPYFTVVRPIEWKGLFPSIENGVTCCNADMITASPVPQNHYPFPSSTGSTNSKDPRGWLYTMAEALLPTVLGSQNVSSLFAPATISSVRQHCPYHQCLSVSSALGATGVRMVGALLETSTVHVTGTFSTSTTPTATAKPSRETSKTFSEQKPEAAAPGSPTKSPNIPASTPQSRPEDNETAIPPAGTPKDTTTASEKGAAGVSAATNLLTIDSNFNVIRPTVATTKAASKVLDSLPESTASIQNVGALIGSLVRSSGKETKFEGQASIPPQATTAQQDAALPPILIGSSTISANPESQYIIGGQTLAPGSSITIGNTPIALQTGGPDGNVLVIGSSSSVLLPLPTTPPPIVVGSSTITANSDSKYIVAGQTLAPGSSITIGDTSIALQTDGPEGHVLVVGTSSSLIQQRPKPSANAPTIVIDGSTITANSASEYIVAGQTLQLGSSITVGSGSSASVIALQTDDSRTVLVVGTSSSVVQEQHPTGVVTVGDARITPTTGSEYLVGSQRLVPGAPAITVSGTEYSLASDGGQIVAGPSTKVLTSAADIGGYIWSALGGSSEGSSREARTTTGTGPSSGSGTSPQASATETEQSGVPGRLRPLCLGSLMALILLAFVSG